MKKNDDALVEWRWGSQEQHAELYNFGEDPTLNLIMAALWDRFDTSMARPIGNLCANRPCPEALCNNSQPNACKKSMLIPARPWRGTSVDWARISNRMSCVKVRWRQALLWFKNPGIL